MDAANLKVWLPFDTSATEDKLGNEWTAYGSPTIQDRELYLNKHYLRSDEQITFGGADFTVSFYSFMDSSSNNWGGLFCAQPTTNTGNSNAAGRINFYRNNSSNNLALQLVNSSNVNITNDETVVYNFLNSLHYFELDYSHADSMLKIFIDGQLTYTKTVAIERLARYIYLGCTGYDPDGQRMVGTIDEFLLYDGVALHSENFTPPNENDYIALTLEVDGSALVTFDCDVERFVKNDTLLLSSLKVWLPFDTSATEDKLGNEWTTYGTISIGTDNAKTGNALQLNKGYLRSDEAIEFGGADFTISFFGFMNSSSEYWAGFFCAQSTTNTESRPGQINFHRDNKSDRILCNVYDSTGQNTADATLSNSYLTNYQHHFELDYSHADSTLKVFVDGELNLTLSTTIERLSRYIFIGANSYAPSNQRMVGAIDEFLLFDGVALHSENFSPPTADDYIALALELGDSAPVTLTVDIERRLSNAVEVFFDVQRIIRETWRYVNAGTADSLIVTGTTLTNLPESKSKTGTAFYQTTRAKCFDLPATDEIWLKFDVYFDGSNRWRAYNGGANGTTGITAQQYSASGAALSFFSNDTNVQQPQNITKQNQLQTVLLHMISGSSAGVVEAWVDEQFIYTYTGDVNHGEDFADIYLQSDGAGTFFSNVIISNSEIKFGEGYQIFYFDVERRTSKHSEYFFDVARCVVKPIVIPPIGDHFNHLFLNHLTIYSGGAQKFILPKKSKVYVRGEGSTAFRIFSDTDATGKIVGSSYRYDGKFYAELDECEEVFIETTPILTPQQVIKAFMASFNRTTLSGTAALDEAINFATGGKFQTASAVASQFMADLNSSASYTDFLKDYCDIILYNEDTGAITGLDAGGYDTKTRFSIVPEKTPVESWVTPATGSTTTINGLTVHWPTRGASGRLTDAEKFILAGLNSEWIARSLELIRESYELDFNTREGAIVTDIDVNFENSSDLVLAYVNWKLNSSGKATKLSLYVNMRYYAMINTESEDGKSTSATFFLDRVISHELVHAVMATNIDYMSEMPVYIREGAAELVHGIDDERRATIVSLLNSLKDDLENIFSTGGTTAGGNDDAYAAGFMFLRYLAKQGQHSDENSFTYNWWASTYPLLISDGATDSDYNVLTDNTRQIFYPDILRILSKLIEYNFDIKIQNAIPVELFAAVKRALLADVNLFTRDKEIFFSDETNPFVNPTSTVPASSYSPPASADLPINTDGLQNFEIAIAEQQLTDQVRFSAVIPFDIMQQVKGQYLDYPYNMRVERVQQQGIIYSCDCCSDVDQLLYTQMAYKIPATTTWQKIDGEEVDGTPKTVEIQTVYPAASAHVNLIADALNLSPVMQFDDFLSTVLMDEQGGVTYNDLIRDIFGWSSRVPTMLINVIIRDGKLFVIQRGHESHSVDISKSKMTVPVITKELVRTTWGSTPWSKTTTWESEFHSYVPADVVIGQGGGDERVREVMSQFNGNGTQGFTTFKYDKAGRLIQTYTYVYDSNRGGQNTYTTVNNYYDDDGTMIATETFTQSIGTEGQSTSRSVDEKHYITLPNGEKFLSQEVTKRWQNDSGLSITDNDLVDSRVTVHHPSRVGQSHVVTVSTDGEVVGEAGGQNTGDDRVTPFRNKKAFDFANSFDNATGEWKTQTQETGMTVNGLSLYDSSFPIHDEATLIKVTNALRNLNRKTKETVNVTLYDFEHLIDFDDKIILNGATYFLSSNTARTTPRIKFEQNLSLVRWY